MTQPASIQIEPATTAHPHCPACGSVTEISTIEPLTETQNRYTFRCLNCQAVVIEARPL